jgi:hypothetical protein
MYPRVTQIAPRAHTIPASRLGPRGVPERHDRRGGPTPSAAAMTDASPPPRS